MTHPTFASGIASPSAPLLDPEDDPLLLDPESLPPSDPEDDRPLLEPESLLLFDPDDDPLPSGDASIVPSSDAPASIATYGSPMPISVPHADAPNAPVVQ